MNSDKPEEPCATVNINDFSLPLQVNIDGIALSPDLKYIYFAPLTSCKIYRVKTETILDNIGQVNAPES